MKVYASGGMDGWLMILDHVNRIARSMTTHRDESERPVTVEEAGWLFPGKGLKPGTVRSRITKGIDGVRLEADFDGYRYWVCPEAVKRFLDEVSAKRHARTARLGRQVRTINERADEAFARLLKM